MNYRTRLPGRLRRSAVAAVAAAVVAAAVAVAVAVAIYLLPALLFVAAG